MRSSLPLYHQAPILWEYSCCIILQWQSELFSAAQSLEVPARHPCAFLKFFEWVRWLKFFFWCLGLLKLTPCITLCFVIQQPVGIRWLIQAKKLAVNSCNHVASGTHLSIKKEADWRDTNAAFTELRRLPKQKCYDLSHSVPKDSIWSYKACFTCLTACLARPFPWGWKVIECVCFIPNWLQTSAINLLSYHDIPWKTANDNQYIFEASCSSAKTTWILWFGNAIRIGWSSSFMCCEFDFVFWHTNTCQKTRMKMFLFLERLWNIKFVRFLLVSCFQ